MGTTTLYFDAVRSRDVAALRKLLREDAAKDAGPAVAALQRAIEHGLDDVVEVFVTNGVVNVQDDMGSTPVMWAAKVGRDRLVKSFIAAGASVNAADLSGTTALIYAAYSQNLESVKLLLTSGADVTHRNREGQSALDVARLRPFTLKIPFLPRGWGLRRTLRDTPVAKYLRDLVRG